jgi:ABC-2 type transport system ATP-binding protein
VFRRFETRLAEALMAEPAVIVDGVSKRFRLYHERNQSLKGAFMRGRRAKFTDLAALDDVSFQVPRGMTYGIIGENGSGKSTMLKCLARILPRRRHGHHGGQDLGLLELARFHPTHGRDNVHLNGSILGLSRSRRRFDGIVDFAIADTGQEDRIDTPVKDYSSGMYVKLGFSVAINVDPDLLLVDEVLTVGDEQFQRKCAEKFIELKSSGKTIVIVSHSLGMVRDLCEEVALLDHGKLVATGAAGDVIDTYLGGVEHAERDGEHGMRWRRRRHDRSGRDPRHEPTAPVHRPDRRAPSASSGRARSALPIHAGATEFHTRARR